MKLGFVVCDVRPGTVRLQLTRDIALGAISERHDASTRREPYPRQAGRHDAGRATAGQVVAQGIGAYADMKRDAALAAGDKATADAWDEGGTNRTIAHVVGGGLIGGLGGGAFGAVGGAASAGVASALAGKLNGLADDIGGATDSMLAGNIAANVLAGMGGALVGGGAGAAMASNADLYNRSTGNADGKGGTGNPFGMGKDLVSQVCGAGAQCSDATLSAAIQAQRDLNSAAQNNVANTSIATTATVATVAGAVLGPEAYAAYKAAQAGYSLTTAAGIGAVVSGGAYTGSAAVGATVDYVFHGTPYGDAFSDRFSGAGLVVAATFGAYSTAFATQMFNWSGIPNSIQNITTVPGFVIRGMKFALGQTVGKAAQAAVQSGDSK